MHRVPYQLKLPDEPLYAFRSFVCCDTLESWDTAWVPTYRLIAGPVRRTRLLRMIAYKAVSNLAIRPGTPHVEDITGLA
jgi:hypothetical protein